MLPTFQLHHSTPIFFDTSEVKCTFYVFIFSCLTSNVNCWTMSGVVLGQRWISDWFYSELLTLPAEHGASRSLFKNCATKRKVNTLKTRNWSIIHSFRIQQHRGVCDCGVTWKKKNKDNLERVLRWRWTRHSLEEHARKVLQQNAGGSEEEDLSVHRAQIAMKPSWENIFRNNWNRI